MKLHQITGTQLSIPSFRKDANKNMVKILDAAKVVFSKKGAETTIEDVAKKANVGVGTIYRRFSNKHQLATAVVIDVLIKIYEEQIQIANGNQRADQKIRLIFEHFTKINKEYGKIHQMLLEFIHNGELGGDLQESLLTKLKGIFRQVIVQGQQEGIFRDGDPEIYETLMFNMVNPHLVYQLTEILPVEEIPGYISGMILKGVTK